MRIIISNDSQPAINLATEDYLLRHTSADCLFLYINQPSVIVGKHQNTLAEVNYGLCQQKGIAIHRRLSGGGAVYHDAGNLNFCFIRQGEAGKLIDFERYTKPVIAYLATLGAQAVFGGHNDLRCGPYKISGNAEHVFRQRVLHHGTLLIHTDLTVLNSVLWAGREYTDKAVKSVRATVANLSEILNAPLRAQEIMLGLANHFNSEGCQTPLTKDELVQIRQLAAEKYTTWEWNFGYSPAFTLSRALALHAHSNAKPHR